MKNSKKIFFLCILCNLMVVSNLFAQMPAILDSPEFKDISQVIIVKKDEKSSFKANVTAWQKRNNQWTIVLGPMKAVLGRNGIAANGQKQEGDGLTPSGIFKLGDVFGYISNVPTKMIYHQVTEEDVWVDDPNSKLYNRWEKLKNVVDAKSFEYLKRQDDLYKLAIIVRYNDDPIVIGKGSAIFLHIWRNYDQATSGCIAISEDNILSLLKWLNSNQKPIIII